MLGVVSTPHNCNALDCVSIKRRISMQLLACQQGTARHGESGGDKCRGNDATFRQNSLTTTLFCRMINSEQLRRLVETLSRDVHPHRMMNASRSSVQHCNVARSRNHVSLQFNLIDQR